MESFTLSRTGDRPITFTGELIAETDSRWAKGRDSNRWHELALYRTESGNFVLSIQFCTQWQGELDHYTTLILSHPEEITAELRAHDPCAYMDLGPNYPQFREKQAKRAADLQARYNHAVSELLAGMPENLKE